MSKILRKGLLCLVVLCLFLAKSSQASTIYINEVLASNVSTYQNTDYSEYVDIIEIYNTGLTVSLKGYYLTDDRNNPTKWMIQSATVASGGYKLFYADERNTGSHPHLAGECPRHRNQSASSMRRGRAGLNPAIPLAR